MDNLEKKLKEFGNLIRLSSFEQEDIKTDLLRRVFARSSMHTERPRVSPFSTWFKFVPTALIAILFVGGGVSFAAKDTLPGDMLYPFKLGVTERVQGMLLVSTKEQAKFEIILVERRAEEAIKLVRTGKLDDKKNATINLAIDKHTESINLKVEELKTTDKTAAKDLVGSLATSLTEQGEKIAKVAVDVENENKTSATILSTGITKETTASTAVDIAPLAVKMQGIAKDATDKKTVMETEISKDALEDEETDELDGTTDEEIENTDEEEQENSETDIEIKTDATINTTTTTKNLIKGITIEGELESSTSVEIK